MKRNCVTNISILLVLVILVGISSFNLQFSTAEVNVNTENKVVYEGNYETHEPISVNGDIELA